MAPPSSRSRPRRCRAGLHWLLAFALAWSLLSVGVPATAVTSPNELTAGERLPSGTSLWSPDHDFRLAMQGDGNLVLYDRGVALWWTGTRGSGVWAVMQGDGNFVVYSSAGRALWDSRTLSPGSRLVLQNDGNLVVYSKAGKALWASRTAEYHGCAANLADEVTNTGGGSQLITVSATSYTTTYASLTTWQRSGQCWVAKAGPFSARLGRSGLHDQRHEGDGSTPTGLYSIGGTLYGINTASPNATYPYHHLVCGDWWDEEPSSTSYNTFQHVACGTTPSWAAGSEALWTEAPAYDDFAVIDFNIPPNGPRGSGIFLHDDVGGPTNGCVSLPASELVRVLGWLSRGENPHIAIGTKAEFPRF